MTWVSKWIALQIGLISSRYSTLDVFRFQYIYGNETKHLKSFDSYTFVFLSPEKGRDCYEKGWSQGPVNDDIILGGAVYSTLYSCFLYLKSQGRDMGDICGLIRDTGLKIYSAF